MRRIIHPDWIWVTYNLAPWRLDRKYLTCIGLLVLCTIQIVQAWLPADPTEREGRLRGLEEHPPRIPVRRHPQHQLITFYLQLPRPTMGGKSSLHHAQATIITWLPFSVFNPFNQLFFFQNGSRLVKLIFSFTFVRFARTAYSGTFKMTQIFLLISIRV